MLTFKVGFEEDSGFVVDMFTDFLKIGVSV